MQHFYVFSICSSPTLCRQAAIWNILSGAPMRSWRSRSHNLAKKHQCCSHLFHMNAFPCTASCPEGLHPLTERNIKSGLLSMILELKSHSCLDNTRHCVPYNQTCVVKRSIQTDHVPQQPIWNAIVKSRIPSPIRLIEFTVWNPSFRHRQVKGVTDVGTERPEKHVQKIKKSLKKRKHHWRFVSGGIWPMPSESAMGSHL